MFELKTITECELTSFTGRPQKSGPDDVPAVSFRLRFTGVENPALDMFSPTLRTGVYMAVPGQDDLDGVEPSTPLLRSKDVTHLAPDFRYEGWTIYLARGLSDDALIMGSAKVDDFKLDFHEGGRFDYDCRISTADVDEAGAGMLWGRQKCKVFVRIQAPELPAAPIDGTTGHEGLAAMQDEGDTRDATDLFVAGQQELSDDSGGPRDSDTDAGSEPEPAGEDDQAALEADMAQSVASAGLKRKRK